VVYDSCSSEYLLVCVLRNGVCSLENYVMFHTIGTPCILTMTFPNVCILCVFVLYCIPVVVLYERVGVDLMGLKPDP